jgi:hypothetical protein
VTEAEWDRCTDPRPMLGFLRGGFASQRKLRLFAVGCWRRLGHALPDAPAREGIEVAERFADGLATRRELVRASWRCDLAADCDAEEAADEATGSASRRFSYAAGGGEPGTANAWHAGYEMDPEDCAAQCQLFRCIFGNPFRPGSLDPAWIAWHGGAVKRLAEAVYDERELPSGHLDAARLAVLADMFEESGCTDADLLAHLRGPGPHVRGCFAVDALLGRA